MATKRNLASKMQRPSKEVSGKASGLPRYTVVVGMKGKSKSGPCALCRAKEGQHNFSSSGVGGVFPPYHPNCKCGLK
jgi:hypothetical protein